MIGSLVPRALTALARRHPGLQRLTIDAVTPDEVQTCLHAIRAGFAAEGLVLTVPTDPGAVAALGPRLTPDVLARLRRLACC